MGIKKPSWQLKAASAISLRSQSPNAARECRLLADCIDKVRNTAADRNLIE